MPPIQEENDDHNPPKVRTEALREANVLYSAFFGVPLNNNENNDDGVACTTKKKIVTPKNERLCMGGHRETVFGLSFSHDGKYMASASQDSKICIWDVSSHRLLATLSEGIDDKFECLRVAWMNMDSNDNDGDDDLGEKYFLASAGADGIVRLWSGTTSLTGGEGKLKWHAVGTLDHCNGGDDIEEEGKEDNKPQIYALQFIQSKIYPNRNLLLTSTDDCIHLWNVVNENDSVSTNTQSSPPPIKRRKLLLYISVQFTHVNGGHNFGGPRNPSNELYVFDASYCEANGLLGVALSDGSCRVLSILHNSETEQPICQEQCSLRLPPDYFSAKGGRGGHLTALSFDKTGTRLSTCFASGRVVLWSLQVIHDGNGMDVLHPSCISILEADVGRPLFGAKYCGGTNEDLLVTYGVDGKVCLWDSFSVGDVFSPICTLVSHPDYPIYTLDITSEGANQKALSGQKSKLHIAIGGGTEGGFLGVPVYLYAI